MMILTQQGYLSLGHLLRPALNNPVRKVEVPHEPNIWGVRRAVVAAVERSEITDTIAGERPNQSE